MMHRLNKKCQDSNQSGKVQIQHQCLDDKPERNEWNKVVSLVRHVHAKREQDHKEVHSKHNLSHQKVIESLNNVIRAYCDHIYISFTKESPIILYANIRLIFYILVWAKLIKLKGSPVETIKCTLCFCHVYILYFLTCKNLTKPPNLDPVLIAVKLHCCCCCFQ